MSEATSRRDHRRSIPSLLLELAMIVIGVFLGASAEQWRETRHHRDLAMASLRNFRQEVSDNRAKVARVRTYHVALEEGAGRFVDAKGAHTLQAFFRSAHFQGVRSVDFEHTAWDLALATQALSDIEPRLAFAVSHVYTQQQAFAALQNGFMQGAFTPSTFANNQDATGLAWAMAAYLEDVNIQESNLLIAYDQLLPKIDSVLGGPPPSAVQAGTPKSPR